MFRIPLDTRFEVLHTHDAGLAIANAVEADVWGRVSLIGGGRSCQVLYRDYLESMLDLIGVGRLPDEAFGQEPYCTDWLDTEDSQRLLGYQRHSFQEIVRDVARAMGPTRFLARARSANRPLVDDTIISLLAVELSPLFHRAEDSMSPLSVCRNDNTRGGYPFH